MPTPLRHRLSDGNAEARAIRVSRKGVPLCELRGRTAMALAVLVASADRGITVMECLSWTYLLGAYVYRLRRAGIEIRTIREVAKGHWRARYYLASPVSIEFDTR